MNVEYVLRSSSPNQYKSVCLVTRVIGTNYVILILIADGKNHRHKDHKI
jgi:hypothetical protein